MKSKQMGNKSTFFAKELEEIVKTWNVETLQPENFENELKTRLSAAVKACYNDLVTEIHGELQRPQRIQLIEQMHHTYNSKFAQPFRPNTSTPIG